MKSVEHWKQVRASELRPFDIVMIPQDMTFPTWSPSGRRIRRTETKYKRVMITSNYLHRQSPYAKLHYTGDTRSITTYTKLDCDRMVWKFVESRISGKLKNELDKIFNSDNRRTFFNPLFGAEYAAGIRFASEVNALSKLQEFLDFKPTLVGHVHTGRTV